MKAAALVLVGGLLTGCTTHITSHPSARIYLDGEYAGTGTAEVGRVGPPHRATVRIELNGSSVEYALEREFTGATLFFGLMSAYTGFYWGWGYPDEVAFGPPSTENPWLKGGGKDPNPWLAPPPHLN